MEATERLLLKEVDHRAMNALALVQSFVNLSKADSVKGYAAAVRGRVHAPAQAHRLLGEGGWVGADLARLIDGETPPELRARVRTHESAVTLPTALVQPMALVLHQLASNAARHGALRSPGGRVNVSWELRADGILIDWRESGVDGVAEPAHLGIGFHMLEGVVKRQLGGRCHVVGVRGRARRVVSSAGFGAGLDAPRCL